MEDKENKPKLLSCMLKGPGPAYKLPPLIGHNGHDPSKHRYPAYTIRHRTDVQYRSIGPGPCYDVAKLTKSGIDNPPAYTIRGREPFKIRDSGPGPGAHRPEQCPPMNHNRRPPAYSMKSRSMSKFTDDGPGPNAYSLPSCIGPKIPDKPAQAAFSIAGWNEFRRDVIGPGPAGYSNLNYDLIKRRCPAYSIKWRHGLREGDVTPGPQYYPLYHPGRRPPMYSFGIRHSECAGNPITDLDED